MPALLFLVVTVAGVAVIVMGFTEPVGLRRTAFVVVGLLIAGGAALTYAARLESEFVTYCHSAGGHVVKTERDHVCVGHDGRFLGPSS